MEKQTTAVTSHRVRSVRGGGQLFFNHAHAADVTGGDVYVDGTPAHPRPAPTIAGNVHDIPGATDNRHVTGNKLTLSGLVGSLTSYAGQTLGTGNAENNTLILKGGAGGGYFYGGWSNQGNATGNTVILSGTSTGATDNGLYGGFSNNTGADVTTGNTLRVTTKDNYAYGIANFEKMQFDLGMLW